MTLKIILITLPLLLYFTRTYLALYFSYQNFFFFKEKRIINFNTVQKNRIIVIIPLYKEQGIIKKLNYSLNKIQETIQLEVDFYLVTSIRELSLPEKKSTYELLSELKWNNNIHIHNLTKICSGKGNVLNQFFHEIGYIEDNTWVGVYDADSLPESNIFHFVNSQTNDIKAIQQPSIYLQNYNRLPEHMKPMALYQTLWSLGTESKRILEYSNKLKNKKSTFTYPYLYPVGHGIFYRYSTLVKLNFFKAIYEDLRIGIPLVLNKENFIVAPFFDSCSFVTEISKFTKQSMSWCNGSWFIWLDIRNINKGKPWTYKITTLFINLKGTLNNLHWSFEGLSLLVSNALYILVFKDILLPILTITVTSLEYVLMKGLQQKYNKISDLIPKERLKLLDVLFGCFRVFLYGFGPAWGSLKYLITFKTNQVWVTKSTQKVDE